MTSSQTKTEWTTPSLKKGTVSDSTSLSPLGLNADGALFTS